MDGLLNFIVDNYVWILTVTIILIFAFIGYFVDIRRQKNDPYRIQNQEEINLENLVVNDNVALNEAINKNANAAGAQVNMEQVDSLNNNPNQVQ